MKTLLALAGYGCFMFALGLLIGISKKGDPDADTYPTGDIYPTLSEDFDWEDFKPTGEQKAFSYLPEDISKDLHRTQRRIRDDS